MIKEKWIWAANDTVEKDSYAEFIGEFSAKADEDVRIQRIVKRDGIDILKARARINAQLNNSELSALADYTIINNGTLEELYDNTLGFIRKIQK
jgi:dephospho-CoA kinase